jgi:alkaline phosphatase/alkaline phosphatase D
MWRVGTEELIDANSRLGRNPGNPDANDPDALIEQPYTSLVPSGGFFEVMVTPGNHPVAAFRWFDELGNLTYELIRTATN